MSPYIRTAYATNAVTAIIFCKLNISFNIRPMKKILQLKFIGVGKFLRGTNLTFDLYQGHMIEKVFCALYSPDFLRNCLLRIHKIWQVLS